MNNTENKEQTFYTTYAEAVNFLHNNYILCNNIVDVDESIWDNLRFNLYDEEDETQIEIYQYYITDASLSDIEYLEKHFSLFFTYSDKLDCFILCVDHLGTSWNYVPCEVLNKEIEVKTYEKLTGLKH